jgi:hypothetical protein
MEASMADPDGIPRSPDLESRVAAPESIVRDMSHALGRIESRLETLQDRLDKHLLLAFCIGVFGAIIGGGALVLVRFAARAWMF